MDLKKKDRNKFGGNGSRVIRGTREERLDGKFDQNLLYTCVTFSNN